MINLLKRRLQLVFRRDRSERGVALAMVVGVAAVMMLLIGTMAAGSVSGLMKSSNDEDWNAAIDAAYAGISDYQGRLANDYTYVQYGNPASSFGATSASRVVTLPAIDNPAFGVGTAGTWATIAGSAGNATYRYEVDNSAYSASGVLKVRATGRVGNTTRTVVADLKQQGFIDYVYFTDYEIRDPAIFGTSCGSLTTVKHAWEMSPARTTACQIYFAAGDTIDGPMHSNDTIAICGGTFKGAVTTAMYKLINNKRYVTAGCDNISTPVWAAGAAGPAYSKTIDMPPTNGSMQQETRTDLPLTVQRPGCLYTGPTSITFNGNMMTVRSPFTKKTEIVGSNPTTNGSTPAMCGAVGDPTKTLAQNAGTLSGATGVTIPVLDHNLIYVQDIPAQTIDPYNYWAPSVGPNKLTRTAYCLSADGKSAGNGIGYPVANEVLAQSNSYTCAAGDAFVSGTFDAAMTIAASRYIYVTGDLKRQDTQNDILGLVATNSVWVWNPMNSSNRSLIGGTDRQIDAAIVSLGSSFQVQNYAIGGSRGDLTVNGSIAQEFRGTVASGTDSNGNASNGYNKNYVYDPRFRAIAPPKFISPVATTYGINVEVEVKTAFNAAGASTS